MRLLLTYSLAFSLIFSPTYSHAQIADNNEVSNPEEYGFAVVENPDRADLLSANPELAGTLKSAKEWGQSNEEKLSPILELASRIEAEYQKTLKEKGEAVVQKMLTLNTMMIRVAGLGVAEMKLIDGALCPKIILENQSAAYLLLDSSKIDPSSTHLRQYISRLHFNSGEKGRDITLVWFDHTDLSSLKEVHNVTELPRPTPMQYQWWKEKFYASYKKPSANDFTMAVATGLMLQGGLTLGVSLINSHFFGTPINWATVGWVGGFSLGIGTMISSYKNWTQNSGNKLTRVLKQQVVSAAFAYGVVLVASEGSLAERIARISFMTHEGFLRNAKLFSTGMSDNYMKDEWSRPIAMRDKFRLNTGEVKPFGIESKAFAWNRSNLEKQTIAYIIPFTIKVSIQMAIAQFATVAWYVPFMPLMALPLTMYVAKRYSRHIAEKAKNDPFLAIKVPEMEKDAEYYERRWNNSFGMDVKDIPEKFKSLMVGLGNAAVALKNKVTAQNTVTVTTCGQLFN